MPYLFNDEHVADFLDSLEKKFFSAGLDRALKILQEQRLEAVPCFWWPEAPRPTVELRIGERND